MASKISALCLLLMQVVASCLASSLSVKHVKHTVRWSKAPHQLEVQKVVAEEPPEVEVVAVVVEVATW